MLIKDVLFVDVDNIIPSVFFIQKSGKKDIIISDRTDQNIVTGRS